MKYLVLFLMFLTGCSAAPFTTTSSALTQGDGNWRAEGFISPVLGASIVRGVGESVDVGSTLETSGSLGITSSVWAKTALYQQRFGSSFSLVAGAFTSLDFADSSGYFVGPVLSYNFENIELYTEVRRVQLNRSSSSTSDNDYEHSLLNDFDFKDHSSINYGQVNFGFNYIWDKQLSINLGGICLRHKKQTNCEPVIGTGVSF